MSRVTPMFIAGRFTTGAAAASLPVVNPATEARLAEVPLGTAEDVAAAVAAAARAFPGWRGTPAAERAERLHQTAARLRAAAGELARLVTMEQGKPLRESEEEVARAQVMFDYYAELARHDGGRVLPAEDPDQLDVVLREPYGVVACLTPWNYPVLLLAWKLAPALAAGNTVVVKPSEYAPLAALRLIEVGLADYPPGVVNVVTGDGATTGAALVAHPDTAVVAFTGSLETGRRIAAVAAPAMKRLHLELGGKDPFVVGPDVELDTAVRAAAYAGLLNAGQVCTSAERVYVPASRLRAFVDRLSELVETLKVGDGLDPDTDIGPLIRPHVVERIAQQLAEAVRAGARIRSGGGRPPNLPRGYFFAPTVVVDVNHTMRLMREETLGPVLPVMGYGSFEEAIALANDTVYGLGATLLTHDARLVKRFAEGVNAGTIWINDPLTDTVTGPFGGSRQSGGARELGQEGLDAFVQVKHLHWDVEGRPKPYWFSGRQRGSA
jgi:acyl-CoA reductase-like NAD-dependent aldehyde dehydrogenase